MYEIRFFTVQPLMTIYVPIPRQYATINECGIMSITNLAFHKINRYEIVGLA